MRKIDMISSTGSGRFALVSIYGNLVLYAALRLFFPDVNRPSYIPFAPRIRGVCLVFS
jgi:hypothetical protein